MLDNQKINQFTERIVIYETFPISMENFILGLKTTSRRPKSNSIISRQKLSDESFQTYVLKNPEAFV